MQRWKIRLKMPFMRCVISLLNGCIESPYQTAVAYRASETHATSRASLMTLKKPSMKMAYQIAVTTFSFYPMTRQRRPRKTSHKANHPNTSPQTMYTMWRRDKFRKTKNKKKKAQALRPFATAAQSPNAGSLQINQQTAEESLTHKNQIERTGNARETARVTVFAKPMKRSRKNLTNQSKNRYVQTARRERERTPNKKTRDRFPGPSFVPLSGARRRSNRRVAMMGSSKHTKTKRINDPRSPPLLYE